MFFRGDKEAATSTTGNGENLNIFGISSKDKTHNNFHLCLFQDDHYYPHLSCWPGWGKLPIPIGWWPTKKSGRWGGSSSSQFQYLSKYLSRSTKLTTNTETAMLSRWGGSSWRWGKASDCVGGGGEGEPVGKPQVTSPPSSIGSLKSNKCEV